MLTNVQKWGNLMRFSKCKLAWWAIFFFVALAGCAPSPDRTDATDATDASPLSGDPLYIQNEGYLCFSEYADALLARGYFIPKGCFSSSCTRPIQQSIDIKVDTASFAIRFNTLFVVIDPFAAQRLQRGSYACTEDCGGAGIIKFEIGDVERGNYTVWLGERNLGRISFPPETITGRDSCFGEQW
jgi:hypothetical protein